MARQPRFVIPGQPQHVIQRGNNRDITFVNVRIKGVGDK
jgi:putative transposase